MGEMRLQTLLGIKFKGKLSWCLIEKWTLLCRSSVQLLSRVQLFATPWTTARQASLSITNSQSLLKLLSIELVIPSSHLNLCPPLLLPPSIFPSIRGFSSESALCIRWPNYWNFSFLYFLYRIAFAFLSKIYWTYLCGSISEYSILKMCACLLPSIPLCLDYCN